jgi:Holliday junction DNA helicase RuvA
LLAVVAVRGVGYEVNIPVTTAEKLPAPGQPVKLHTFAVYREDSQQLYGFAARDDRDFFRLLIEKVSGVGPKIALGLLSRLSSDTLKNAIARADLKLLSECPGIGKKTAERLIVELRDKVLPAATATPAASLPADAAARPGAHSAFSDAVSALVALGYKAPDADKAARGALSLLGPTATSEALIKQALGKS